MLSVPSAAALSTAGSLALPWCGQEQSSALLHRPAALLPVLVADGWNLPGRACCPQRQSGAGGLHAREQPALL